MLALAPDADQGSGSKPVNTSPERHQPLAAPGGSLPADVVPLGAG